MDRLRITDERMDEMKKAAVIASTIHKWTAHRKGYMLDTLFNILEEAQRARAAEENLERKVDTLRIIKDTVEERLSRIAFRFLENFENGKD